MPRSDGVESNSFSAGRATEAPVGIWQHGAAMSNPLLVRSTTGAIIGGLPTPGAAPVTVLSGNGLTIPVGTAQKSYVYIPCTTGAGRTGIILSPGLYDGQIVIVVNRDTTKTNTIEFAVAATSNVAGTFATVQKIAGGQACLFVWDAGSALWYSTKHAAGEA